MLQEESGFPLEKLGNICNLNAKECSANMLTVLISTKLRENIAINTYRIIFIWCSEGKLVDMSHAYMKSLYL